MNIQTASLNGINLHYQVEGQGEPLLLLHGGTGCHEDWAYCGRDQFVRKIWQEQYEATRTIREAIEFCQGSTPRLRVCCRTSTLSSSGVGYLQPYELTGYLASLKPSAGKKLQKLLYVSS